SGIPPFSPGAPWRAPGHSALILAPTPAGDLPEEPEMGTATLEDYDIHPALRGERGKHDSPARGANGRGARMGGRGSRRARGHARGSAGASPSRWNRFAALAPKSAAPPRGQRAGGADPGGEGLASRGLTV